MDTLFFVVSKQLGALLRPDTWIVLALGVIVIALAMNRRRFALWASSITLTTLITLSIFPLDHLLLQPLERTYPAQPALERVDGIIVLGGGGDPRASIYWDQIQLNESGERYTAALALARRFPEARLLFSGGTGVLLDLSGQSIPEADIAQRFFREHGIAPERLRLEGQSRNTAENARLSRILAAPTAGETWVLVTSAFHMPRAMRSFEAAGWTGVVPWPVDYRTAAFVDGIGWNLSGNLRALNTAIREQVGQLAYRLTGR